MLYKKFLNLLKDFFVKKRLLAVLISCLVFTGIISIYLILNFQHADKSVEVKNNSGKSLNFQENVSIAPEKEESKTINAATEQKISTDKNTTQPKKTDDGKTATTDNGCPWLDNRPGVIAYPDHDCQYSLKALGELNVAVVIVEDPALRQENSQFYKFVDGPNTLYVPVEDMMRIIKSSNSTENILSCGYKYDAENKLVPSCSQTESVMTFNYMNSFLAREAKVYNVKQPPTLKITFFGPYQKRIQVNADNQQDVHSDTDKAIKEAVGADNSQLSKFDIVSYIVLSNPEAGSAYNKAFTSHAHPESHQVFVNANLSSFPYLSEGVFMHEIMHLFGAADMMAENPDCKFTRNNISRYDIMCSPYFSNTPKDSESGVGESLARQIGWIN